MHIISDMLFKQKLPVHRDADFPQWHGHTTYGHRDLETESALWADSVKTDTYGTKCVGRIVTKSMSYFLHLCDCSLPYCATLEAWNWFEAGQHLDASHPRSSVWPNQNVTLFSGNYFLKNFKQSLLLNR